MRPLALGALLAACLLAGARPAPAATPAPRPDALRGGAASTRGAHANAAADAAEAQGLPAASGGFGRLFFSAEERRRIERPPATSSPTEAAPPPAPIRVDGIVRSSRGDATVWLNGRPVPAGHARLAPSDDSVRIVDGQGGSVVVHVGETYRPDTGARENPLPRVEVHPPVPTR